MHVQLPVRIQLQGVECVEAQMKPIRIRYVAVASVFVVMSGVSVTPAHAEEEVGPVACAVTYLQLSTLRREALEPATIRKRRIPEFQPFDFAAREARMKDAAAADPDISQDDMNMVYSLVGLASMGGFGSEFGMDNETIVATLKQGAQCDAHYNFTPDTADLLKHF